MTPTNPVHGSVFGQVLAPLSRRRALQHLVLGHAVAGLGTPVTAAPSGASTPGELPQQPAPAGAPPVFDLQGHRGCRGLLPENTLAAFDRALSIGVSTLEMDVAITSDGVAVLSHDPHLLPDITRNAQGQWLAERGPLIKDLTLAELQRYDVGRSQPGSTNARNFPEQQGVDGERIPTLASVFERVRQRGAHHVQFDIETKIFPMHPTYTRGPAEMVDIMLKVIHQAGMTQRVMIQSFDWRTLQLLRRAEPQIRTVYLTVQSNQGDTLADGLWTNGMLLKDHASVPAMVKASGGHIWSPNFNNVTPGLVREAQALGLQVIPWTVNQANDMLRLIDMGVNGLISDYPDRLRAAMAHRGLPLPPTTPGQHSAEKHV
jgi:glycerophosphoryl diester phosphodiesterase